MEGIIIPAIFIIIGIVIIVKGIYDRFFNSFIPNPKKWGKARARIIGRHHYKEKVSVSYSVNHPTGSGWKDSYEKCIAYTVDGKRYKKYVDDTENGAVHIYYRLKNPDIIRTMSEIKRRKREGRSNLAFGEFIVCGVFMLVLGIVFANIG